MVTYGLACAPFQAIRTFRQFADDEKARFLCVKVLRQEVYMDDVLMGAPSLDEAREICNQLTQLCMVGGFPLKK